MDKSLATAVKGFSRAGALCAFKSLAMLAILVAGGIADADSPPEEGRGTSDSGGSHVSGSVRAEGRFSTLYEPSGIAPLSDGRFLVVEDEPDRALRLITAKNSISDGVFFEDESPLELPSSQVVRLTLGVLDDLEGVAHDRMQRYYVVTSHDDSVPYWSSERQKLLRFSIHDGRMEDVTKKLTLRRDLLDKYPQLVEAAQEKRRKKDPDFSIEALAYDRRRDALLVGLRAPVLNGKSIIVRLLNPEAYLADDVQPVLDENLWLIDLDKGGLRAMIYDDQTDQLLLVSRREDRKNSTYKLWRLGAGGEESPVRIELKELKPGGKVDLLDSVEGMAFIELDSSPDSGVLFVRDNGNAKKEHGAGWFVLTRKQLGIDYKAEWMPR